jgi:hypothetical protein
VWFVDAAYMALLLYIARQLLFNRRSSERCTNVHVFGNFTLVENIGKLSNGGFCKDFAVGKSMVAGNQDCISKLLSLA